MPSRPDSRSGCQIGRPSRSASTLIAGAVGARPRPAGRSGCVTISRTSWPAATRPRSEGTANAGVPRKASRAPGAMAHLRIIAWLMSTIAALVPCQIEPDALRRRLAALPTSPGVYMYRNPAGEILYIGKAVNLKNRVRSYFRRNGQTTKIRQMVSQIADWELIVTGSELEALVLECNLIKKHRPKYNVRLRDDKHYPYIKVSLNEPWPRVYITRRIGRDGARYFGPFTDSRSVWKTLDLLNKLFPYRTCHIQITGDLPRPCLQFHIHRCLGPCIGAVSNEEYMAVMQQVVLFLEGKHEQIVATLRERMDEAAERMEFERAAVIRDQIRSVEKVTERQRVVDAAMKDQDVVAFARANGDACVEVFFIRGGKLIGREDFLLEGTRDEEAGQIMASFVTQFYESAAYVPPEIVLQNH